MEAKGYVELLPEENTDLGLDLGEDYVYRDAVQLASLKSCLSAQLGKACAVHTSLGRALSTCPKVGERQECCQHFLVSHWLTLPLHSSTATLNVRQPMSLYHSTKHDWGCRHHVGVRSFGAHHIRALLQKRIASAWAWTRRCEWTAVHRCESWGHCAPHYLDAPHVSLTAVQVRGQIHGGVDVRRPTACIHTRVGGLYTAQIHLDVLAMHHEPHLGYRL